MFLEVLRDSPMSFVMIHVYSPLSSRLRFVRIRLACVETTVPSGPRHSSEVMGSESAWRHLSSSVGSLSLTRMGSISGVMLGGFSAAERGGRGGRRGRGGRGEGGGRGRGEGGGSCLNFHP